ncbi:MAG: hypothetical protein IH627_11260 [Rubrivivax sp.]|nr:hypothetical protein [Rubrivivax sp.]
MSTAPDKPPAIRRTRLVLLAVTVLVLAAASSLRRDLDAGATLDVHAVDQMLVFLALADGPCAFRAAELGSHARTVMWLLEKLTPARFDVSPAGAGVLVRVLPGSGAVG